MSSPASVRASGWGWRYAGRQAWAAREIDVSIEPGERVLLLGASGAGKSTVLAALAGVLGGSDEGESTGSLMVGGADPARVRGASGLLMQDPDAQVILARVGDDVAFAAENLGVPRTEIWERVHESLDAVGLRLPLEHPTSRLSGGQKQRLALAGLLAMRPGLLLLDEPTANLDPAGVEEVRDAVGDVLARTGATLVVVEHRVDVWRPLIDRVIVLSSEGGVLADGPVDAVLSGQADALDAAGVWLPGRDPAPFSARPIPPGDLLLAARSLSLARPGSQPLGLHVYLDVSAGSATALTGANGVGKSTLALTLAGLLRPAGGELRAREQLAAGIGSAPAAWSSSQLLTRIGSVFQNPEHQFLASSVRAELAIGPRALGVPPTQVASMVDELLARLRLDGLAQANPFTLSGGQKRRLSVATALATRPRILVLDEPTFGQDSNTWRELVSMLLELRSRGHAIVAATHDEAFVRAIGATPLRLGDSRRADAAADRSGRAPAAGRPS
ncbi:ABC transporter ATP-binding protein [Microbacterium sp. STN6]|uniref:ABC transporter ATP-binding protein n=1 Tax=Microbacterium sp. STN6 TaxID=2995588 RepID=UPI00226101F2|nr:ABC transporter ATP-binding protein [Microbacterium sp. STN6]MCX7522173.1 ABC transporter ATP-binding protein [Microbacterium sp. STN6]